VKRRCSQAPPLLGKQLAEQVLVSHRVRAEAEHEVQGEALGGARGGGERLLRQRRLGGGGGRGEVLRQLVQRRGV